MPTELKTEASKLNNIKIISIDNNQTPINFMDGLALLLIGLKLTDHLQHWTWIEVLSPLWGPFMIAWFLRLIVRTFGAEVDNDQDENGGKQ